MIDGIGLKTPGYQQVIYLNSNLGFAPAFWSPLLFNERKGDGLVALGPF